jgi:hypothetical protein
MTSLVKIVRFSVSTQKMFAIAARNIRRKLTQTSVSSKIVTAIKLASIAPETKTK